MEARIARLESDVGHMRVDIADLKTDVRAVRSRLDELAEKHPTALHELEVRLVARMDAMNFAVVERVDSVTTTLTGRIDAAGAALTHRMDAANHRMDKLETRIETLAKDLASAKIWALCLYVALAGAVYATLARAMGWL